MVECETTTRTLFVHRSQRRMERFGTKRAHAREDAQRQEEGTTTSFVAAAVVAATMEGRLEESNATGNNNKGRERKR